MRVMETCYVTLCHMVDKKLHTKLMAPILSNVTDLQNFST